MQKYDMEVCENAIADVIYQNRPRRAGFVFFTGPSVALEQFTGWAFHVWGVRSMTLLVQPCITSPIVSMPKRISFNNTHNNAKRYRQKKQQINQLNSS